MRKSRLTPGVMLLAGTLMTACAGEKREPQQAGGEAAPVDVALAQQGEKVFQTKGCVGCHTIGKGRLTGPDLKGVTGRRAYGWFAPWVTNPDSMLKVDSTARQLVTQYMTPMPNMGVTQDEARALWEYLRHEPN